jgi:diaminohydroxyphosphoribosylaminopyrimidine deaminase / 5-amino-6-(5-phosphoribosylamino)uracil reductase
MDCSGVLLGENRFQVHANRAKSRPDRAPVGLEQQERVMPSRPKVPTPARELSQAAPGDDPYSPILNADPSRPFVVAQLGQSLDGRIATPTGESRWINKDAALDHVHRLRSAVDAVVVGIGTVMADDPILNVRRVSGPNPARVVIDPSGRMPLDKRCMSEADGARRLIVTDTDRAAAPGVEMVVVPRIGDRLQPAAIVAALYDRGLRRLLIEGGAWTVSSFIDAGVIDRLHVLVAPVILGSGKTGLALAPIERLAQARRPLSRVHVLADGDVLFDCDLRQPQPA